MLSRLIKGQSLVGHHENGKIELDSSEILKEISDLQTNWFGAWGDIKEIMMTQNYNTIYKETRDDIYIS